MSGRGIPCSPTGNSLSGAYTSVVLNTASAKASPILYPAYATAPEIAAQTIGVTQAAKEGRTNSAPHIRIGSANANCPSGSL